ncbi:MAG: hypothetical protein GY937_23960 [bacterium]|nr:hypothetical protein [bacterium]
MKRAIVFAFILVPMAVPARSGDFCVDFWAKAEPFQRELFVRNSDDTTVANVEKRLGGDADVYEKFRACFRASTMEFVKKLDAGCETKISPEGLVELLKDRVMGCMIGIEASD